MDRQEFLHWLTELAFEIGATHTPEELVQIRADADRDYVPRTIGAAKMIDAFWQATFAIAENGESRHGDEVHI